MSSKTTITKAEGHHLYERPYDNETIYLELSNGIEFKTIDNYYGDVHERKLVLTFKKEKWKEIVEGYSSSHSEDS